MTPTELRDRAEHVLRTEVAPALELDSGEIHVLDVTDGVARVRLGNVCGG